MYDAAVDRPEGEVPTPTDHSTTFAGLSSMERYVVAKAIMGADLTECMSRDALTEASRECQALFSADVMEVYSFERVARLCADFDLKPGSSLDPTNGFNAYIRVDRKRAWNIVERGQPLLIVGSPPCTYFSTCWDDDKHSIRDDAAWMQGSNDNLRGRRSTTSHSAASSMNIESSRNGTSSASTHGPRGRGTWITLRELKGSGVLSEFVLICANTAWRVALRARTASWALYRDRPVCSPILGVRGASWASDARNITNMRTSSAAALPQLRNTPRS